jgi:molybdate transport system substrate-binding protein
MHSPVRSLVTAFAAALFLFQAGNATATEIKILSAVGMKAALDELGPKFERASGHTLRIEFANLGAVLKRVEDGETADGRHPSSARHQPLGRPGDGAFH